MGKELETRNRTDEAAAAITVSHLLDPTSHFDHPSEVLAASHLDCQEKRAILASWASDQYAIESIPALRHHPGTGRAVSLDEILQALKALDGDRPAISDNGSPPPTAAATRRFDIRSIWPAHRRRPRIRCRA